jgi:hypothetical protein
MTAMPDPGPGTPISDLLRARVLLPYRPNARYVLRAQLTHGGNGTSPHPDAPASWLRIDGECGFAAPCYIDATGHLNAVEVNITYNQLLYLGLAEAVRQQLLPELRHWSLEDFFRAQLPDVLIASYDAAFRRPMRSENYAGWFQIVGTRCIPSKSLLLLPTRAHFHDAHGGECTVNATIAIVNWRPA